VLLCGNDRSYDSSELHMFGPPKGGPYVLGTST
jgi:hypothetical protein